MRTVLLCIFLLWAPVPKSERTVSVVLHLPQRLVEELRIAQASRNNTSLEQYITEILANAVSDCSVLPGGCKGQ